MDLPGSSYRLAQCFPLAVGLCPGTGASGRDGETLGARRREIVGTSCICQHPQRGQARMNNTGFGHRKQAISDCRYICPLTQYGLQCGHKLSDGGSNAMTGAQGPRNRKRKRAKGEGGINHHLIGFRPVAYYAKMCTFGHHPES